MDRRKWVLWSEACREVREDFKANMGDPFKGQYVRLTLEYLRECGRVRLVDYDPDEDTAQLAAYHMRYYWKIRNPELGPRLARLPMIERDDLWRWMRAKITCELCPESKLATLWGGHWVCERCIPPRARRDNSCRVEQYLAEVQLARLARLCSRLMPDMNSKLRGMRNRILTGLPYVSPGQPELYSGR